MIELIQFSFAGLVRFASNKYLTTNARQNIAARLRKTFPLRARVVGGGAGEVVLNVGTGEGAAVGQKLMIFRESAGGQREVVGEAEISEVTDKQSRAKLSGDARPLPAGLKAIERS